MTSKVVLKLKSNVLILRKNYMRETWKRLTRNPSVFITTFLHHPHTHTRHVSPLIPHSTPSFQSNGSDTFHLHNPIYPPPSPLPLHTSKNMSMLSPLSFKLGLVSTFVVFTVAVAFKFSVPLITEFVASDVPIFWNVLLQWLKPPYLYLIINCIIISIVASSKLQHKRQKTDVSYDGRYASGENDVDDEQSRGTREDVDVSYDLREKDALSRDFDEQRRGYVAGFEDVIDLSEKTEDVKEEVKKNVDVVVERSGDDVDSVATAAPVRRSDSMEFLERWFEKESAKQREKPLISSRFSQKKSVKNSSEGGKALRVAKPKRNDTLESTWKMITEGGAMPLTRHLKKSDTWETHVRHNNTPPDAAMKKSETFHERNSTTTAVDGGLRRESSLRLKKEPSLSQDDLNKRVEAFIKKFNEEMRLQRQRSIDQDNEMIRRGV